MAMDVNMPEQAVKQEEAMHEVHEYAKNFKDVAYTKPATGRTGFTALTLDGHFVVQFGYDDENDSFPGWYYSVSAVEDYSHSATGSGMQNPGQAEHLIRKVIGGETWYETHQPEIRQARAKREKIARDFSEGVISTEKDSDGMYPTLASEEAAAQ